MQQVSAVRGSKFISGVTLTRQAGSRQAGWPGFPAVSLGCIVPTLLFAATLLLAQGFAFGQTVAPAAKVHTRTNVNVSTIEGLRTRATFTVNVADTDRQTTAVPTGSVSFMIGEHSIGSAFLDAEGRATYTATALPIGMQDVTAVYEGDAEYQASTSVPAAVNSLASGVPAFTLSASNTALKVVAGATGTTVISATPENGFNQAVSLSCSGAPYVSVTCVFTPSAVTPTAPTKAAPSGTAALSTLNIQTIAPSGASIREQGTGMQTAYAVALPGILALAGLGLTRKRAFGTAAKSLGLLILLLAGGLGMGACSQRYRYNNRGPDANPGTPVGNYTITVSGITGTGSSLSTATTQVTLTVTAK